MISEPIVESEMTFGPYPDENCFYIEKSETYRKIQLGVKIGEFLLLRGVRPSASVVWIIEAKSSSPQSTSQPNFDEFINDIRDKLTNAFSLCLAMCLKRHKVGDPQFPASFQRIDLSKVDFRLILVIKGHPKEWLPPLHEVLGKSLRGLVKTWALSPSAVIVLNESMAQEFGLIRPTPGVVS